MNGFQQRYQTGHQRVPDGYAWIIISALLITVPLYFPAFWFLVFAAHIPLFYAALTYPLTLWHGFWWGLVCWSGQFVALFWVVFEHGYGSLRMIVPVGLIIYCALYSALCFYTAAWLCRNNDTKIHACIWVICITIYYLIMRYTILWIIGVATGYPLALPLLPLAEYPQCLVTLPYLTSAGLVFCLLTAAMSSAYYLITRKRWVLVLSACTLFPFCIGWFMHHHDDISPLSCMIVTTAPPIVQGALHPRDCMHDINACITEKLTHKPQAAIVIVPESSYPYALNMQTAAIDLWSVNALHKGQLLIIGAYFQQGDELYNGIYGIKECRVIFHYVKSCRMPFTEYVPFPWSMISSARSLFLKNKCGFSSKDSSRIVPLTDTCSVQCALCSEFFFDAYDQECKLPLLVLVNDRWFSCAYIRRLMYLFARYTALSRSLDIIYSSYSYGVFISKRGINRVL